VQADYIISDTRRRLGKYLAGPPTNGAVVGQSRISCFCL
jgi:hypothetical protein